MGTGANNKLLRTASGARELVRLTAGKTPPRPPDEINEIDDAFSEWDESAPVPAGSQLAAVPAAAKLATHIRRKPGFTPESLEEAIRSVIDDDDLYEPPMRYAAGTQR